MPFLSTDPLDPGSLLAIVRRGKDGGLALFVGVVRNENEGHPVDRLEYEAYGPMAEREMARIAEDLARSHPEAQVLFRHRVGALEVGDVAVVVAASAPHRAEAFAACRAGIEAIKARVPIWKREVGPSGSVWLEPCGEQGHLHESD
ncbi:MAG: molybdenum cofactor biosynthesis protein MoaE [Acidobacteriota bacterium]